MGILPSGGIDLSGSVQVRTQPSRTWYIDQETGRIGGTADGLQAMRQAVEIILRTERFRWQIYQPSSGVQLQELVGMDSGYAAVELCRRCAEALKMDDRVLGVEDYEYTLTGRVLSARFTVKTIYGDIRTGQEVDLS